MRVSVSSVTGPVTGPGGVARYTIGLTARAVPSVTVNPPPRLEVTVTPPRQFQVTVATSGPQGPPGIGAEWQTIDW